VLHTIDISSKDKNIIVNTKYHPVFSLCCHIGNGNLYYNAIIHQSFNDIFPAVMDNLHAATVILQSTTSSDLIGLPTLMLLMPFSNLIIAVYKVCFSSVFASIYYMLYNVGSKHIVFFSCI
jgi:hypothetical protein